jgi:hypothetical protein
MYEVIPDVLEQAASNGTTINRGSFINGMRMGDKVSNTGSNQFGRTIS